ncbi:LLM class flavin-dependent oxidoreductase [Mycolicibacterium stellerae]|uniref:LLM class flavin-dependent oxidoreductase n=1 Tax=Mycolicibacterium stellerae TaxID=2358193 RepID=UPI000F0B648D|nr:LLM class flavin-dependent oxidoreductase [Mycolicibacterium stellerae]
MTTIDFAPTEPRPVEETVPLVDRRETNPMFNDQKMKLGLFGTNCSYGLIMSHAPTTYEVSWKHTVEIAQRADALGFEALVPVARWKGFGGTTNFNGNCFETYSWAAGLAQATEQIAIFATSHLPTVHPIVAAKAATTIDRISGGRFGLNLVMGWVEPEMAMFGGSQRQHDDRYAFGQEWIDYTNDLWTKPGAFSFHGKYFDGDDVESYPKPHQAPRPALINAGNSKSGIEFSARNVDFNFASLDTLENMRAYTSAIVEKARTDYHRTISPMTYGLVVCRDTEKEAKADFQRVVDDGDWGAAGNVIKMAMSGASQSFDHAKEFQERFIAGWGGYPIVGTPEQCVEEIGKLNEAGMDGIIMGMIDYNEEMKYFGDAVMPLLRQAGLRH